MVQINKAAHSEAELQAMAEKELREKQEIVKSGYYLLWYSGDDWTLPEYDEKGNSLRMQPSQWMLKNDNQLPPLVVSRNPEDESGVRVPNETGMNAVKQEILSGHGVMVTYKAEVFSPVGSNTDLYTNYENWAVYSYGPEKTLPHRVCIVGWDDNYPAENFTHEVHVTDSEGNRSVDAQLTAKTTPPGNGAWLIKNSRGSETDAIPDGMRAPDGTTYPEHSSNYGIVNEEGLHTGYNWISYYDQFLDYPESMEFTIDADRDHSGILQYDFLIKDFRFNYEKQSEHPVHAANVFTADQDMELTAVSARTVHDNSRVRFRIVKLNENAKDPEDGEELEQFSKTFRYFGYHRTDLLTPIALKKGDRFSVITTTDYTDDDGKRISYYSVAHDFESPDKETIGQTYARPGESFVMESGEWQDWTKVEKPEEEDSEEYEESFPIDPTIKVYDNFCIKVFFRKQQ